MTACLSIRVAAATPPLPSRRLCRFRHEDAAFALIEEARPVELNYYEATSTFTLVTTRIVAHPAPRGFVDGLQKVTFPSPPAIQATGLPAVTLAGLSPASACSPSLGTLKCRDLTPLFAPMIGSLYHARVISIFSSSPTNSSASIS